MTNQKWKDDLKDCMWHRHKTRGYGGNEFMYESNFERAFDQMHHAIISHYDNIAQPPQPTRAEIEAAAADRELNACCDAIYLHEEQPLCGGTAEWLRNNRRRAGGAE